jgi:hypothetical protein
MKIALERPAFNDIKQNQAWLCNWQRQCDTLFHKFAIHSAKGGGKLLSKKRVRDWR